MNSKLLTLLLLLIVSHVNALAGLRAGIAVRTVNPDPLLPVSGGVGPSHPVNRREGDLTVQGAGAGAGRHVGGDCERGLSRLSRRAGQPGPRRGEGDPGAEHPDWRDPHPQRAGLLWLPGRRRRHGAGRQVSGAGVRPDGRGDPRSGHQPPAGAAQDRHRRGQREDRLQLLCGAVVRSALSCHPGPGCFRQADRHAGQLRHPPRGAGQRRRHLQPGPGRAALRAPGGKGRRDGNLHE